MDNKDFIVIGSGVPGRFLPKMDNKYNVVPIDQGLL